MHPTQSTVVPMHGPAAEHSKRPLSPTTAVLDQQAGRQREARCSGQLTFAFCASSSCCARSCTCCPSCCTSPCSCDASCSAHLRDPGTTTKHTPWHQQRQAGTHTAARAHQHGCRLPRAPTHLPAVKACVQLTQHARLLRAVAQHCTVITLHIPTNTSSVPVEDILGSQLHPQAVSLPAVLLLRRALLLQRLLQALLQLLFFNRRHPQRGLQASQLTTA